MELIDEHRAFGGAQQRYKVQSKSLAGESIFSVFLPPNWSADTPVLYWLSGLTCTDENFVQKAGAQRVAAELGIALVAPDTSPRGDEVANDDSYDLGQGAGFYLNATQQPWQRHYQMETFIVNELPEYVRELGLHGKASISGHSMGGHGALVLGLRHPERYCSVSAFSPIANPSDCGWGEKAFGTYLGNDKSVWYQHDASKLLSEHKAPWPILVDVGLADQFLTEQLKVERLEQAAAKSGSELELNRHEGYDHSYFFVSSFIENHLRFHAGYLKA
ncbi:S-formylglutathione hydrolase [Pseudidiomarina planktonica]|uniref:S-formylglutathione hydrolase n=1 Tax=Pseudidiomarina planktonica TaxID=1323738 RepID=A0A1Y6F0L0_9GAMM|nr:S-formylglutathione hydrolase [Pseudidiomarina planktonica]RUO65141.1 S-formylglutathione hydrolase [Pseudidiomarina planktonica]SMQ66312.1 S-formylglutathione hydrolase [Pseudidiomarina planktonica]